MFTRTQNRFRPALDALEARDCLSGMSLLGGHTLLITGDSHANHVVIRQDDAANSLVVVVDDMAQAFRSDQVSTVLIDLRGGDDSLSYQLINRTFRHDKTIFADLGRGNDTADLDFSTPTPSDDRVSIQGRLNVLVDAGAGNDRVNAAFGRVDHGQLTFLALLGSGNDMGTARLQGGVAADSSALLAVFGEGGDDGVAAFGNPGAAYDGPAWFIHRGEHVGMP